jgi:hypothetical protein
MMAHESFEDPGVATQMNEGFVNVKVDREERPDLDAVSPAPKRDDVAVDRSVGSASEIVCSPVSPLTQAVLQATEGSGVVMGLKLRALRWLGKGLVGGSAGVPRKRAIPRRALVVMPAKTQSFAIGGRWE